eukprot:CAMPEP_0183733680 /NCGR_PEP_ID=MMETSP0737-20130205/41733_1 /TAXON_ID=385413 /ORGANISM="Thalassiosira miniscula, Strain CCMP1093" /LENGTH=52 /DNA_ID=CAMNT_0025966979 /DNA_START=9 /DNA_END=164 /DNA_ORIENTATION=-
MPIPPPPKPPVGATDIPPIPSTDTAPLAKPPAPGPTDIPELIAIPGATLLPP